MEFQTSHQHAGRRRDVNGQGGSLSLGGGLEEEDRAPDVASAWIRADSVHTGFSPFLMLNNFKRQMEVFQDCEANLNSK